MNNTEYIPGTSEPEALMDGSLRSVLCYIASIVKGWALNKFQRTLAIISAAVTLFFLINVNGQMYIWMCALAGLLQLWMCTKKVKVESFTMALSYSLLSLGSLITAIQQIANFGGYYFSGWRGAERVIVQLVLYALVAIAWILVLKKDTNKNALRLVFLIVSCVLAVYEVVYVLLVLRMSFKLALYGLAWVGFVAVFAVQVFPLYQKSAPQAHPFAESVPQEAAKTAVFCTGCGRELAPDENFCSVCGTQRQQASGAAAPTVTDDGQIEL